MTNQTKGKRGKTVNNNIPDFTEQEWRMMGDYIQHSSGQPRQNLIELISHVDPGTAQLGMNSGPYSLLLIVRLFYLAVR